MLAFLMRFIYNLAHSIVEKFHTPMKATYVK